MKEDFKEGEWYIDFTKEVLVRKVNNIFEIINPFFKEFKLDDVPPSKDEIKNVFNFEIVRRGLSGNAPIKKCLNTNINNPCLNNRLISGYNFNSNNYWNKRGLIYKNGIWAEPLELTKEYVIQELSNLKKIILKKL